MTENREKDQAVPAESGIAPDAKPAPKPGALLAEYREQAGLTVEQVASRLKMTNRQVLQIEADNFESLSSIAIARGFVRAYARLLNVDPEPLVAMFPNDNPQAHLPVQPRRSSAEAVSIGRATSTFRNRKSGLGKLVGWAVVILLVIGAVAVWRSGMLSFSLPLLRKPAPESKEVPAKQEPKKDAVKTAPASGTVSTELELPKSIVSEEAKPAEPAKQETPATDQAPAVPAAPESAPAPAAAPAPVAPEAQPQPADTRVEAGSTVVPGGKGTLVLRASARSWVQVLRANASGTGSVLFERTLMPGQSESIAIREPVAVTIGYARGVEATFRGKPLELKSAEGSTVARLNLK